MDFHLARISRSVSDSPLDLIQWDAYCNANPMLAIVPDRHPLPFTNEDVIAHYRRLRPRAVIRSGEPVVVMRWYEPSGPSRLTPLIVVCYNDGFQALAQELAVETANALVCTVLYAPDEMTRMERLILSVGEFAVWISTSTTMALFSICTITWEEAAFLYAFPIDSTTLRFNEGLCRFRLDEIVKIERSDIRLNDVLSVRA
jgi:hypothetical protein